MKECKAYRRTKKITCLLLLIGAIIYCFCIFSRWNEIPNHSIQAKLLALGESDKRYCTFRIKINAGGTHSIKNDSIFQNSIMIYDSTINSRDFKQYEVIANKYKTAYQSHKDCILQKNRFYILDYLSTTTINVCRNKSDSCSKYDGYAFGYIDAPKWNKKGRQSIYNGSGFLAFPKEKGKGGGELAFSTNLTNEVPKMTSPWDITQSNYEVKINCHNICCDTISIEFFGAVNFSNMYPTPQKTTMSGVEFTDSVDIQKIMRNGLRFHAEFIELKEMSAMRTFILTAIMSLLISLFANIIYQSICGRK